VPPGRTVTGPGRVNLIGDHTDYNQGVAVPMAIGLGVTVRWTPSLSPYPDSPPAGAAGLVVSSPPLGTVALPHVPTPDPDRLALLEPAWVRLIAAMASLGPPESGGRLDISSTLPTGAGLSSSAALTVALAEVWGDPMEADPVEGDPVGVVARRCQQAEHLIGAPVGIMDPLVCAGGRAGHAMVIDFSSVTWSHVPLPPDTEVVVVDSGQRRSVRSSEYGVRVAECRAAASVIGPLGLAVPADLAGITDPVLARRARHVVEECARARSFAEALGAGDPVAAGALMQESHASLAGLFEVSTGPLDQLVDQLASMPGVLGARMTGAGFGGCVVALTRPGAVVTATLGRPAWSVRPVDGTVTSRGRRGERGEG